MAVTRISDVIVPSVFADYVLRETAEKARIFQAGILGSDPRIGEFLNGGGQTINLPMWNDVSPATGLSGASNVSSDDPLVEATPSKINAASDVAVRLSRNKGWSSADLTADLAGDDPMKVIGNRVVNYWSLEMEAILVKMITGVLLDNIANDASDMVNDVSGSSGATASAIIDAVQTMGDASDALSTIIMHSQIYASLAKQNLIDFIPDSEGRVRFPTYLGYNVIRDDSVLVTGSGGSAKYYTYILGPGAILFGEGAAKTPVETFRYPARGNGAGVEELWSRREMCFHPKGFAFLPAGMAGLSPTNTELATAACWNRIAPERKQINMACLISTKA
jgi:hypothetical protein